jgi:hypothetical protein
VPGDPDVLDSGSGTWWRDAPSQPGPRPAEPRRVDRSRVRDEATVNAAVGRLRLPTWRPTVRLLAILLVGAALGALVDNRVVALLADRAAGSVLDLTLDDEVLLRVDDDPVTPGFRYQVWLRNTGPRQVQVVDATLRSDSLAMEALARPLTADPGTRVIAQVSGSVDCGTVDADGPPAVEVVVTARTADGHTREVVVGGPSSPVRRSVFDYCPGSRAVTVHATGTRVVGERARVALTVVAHRRPGVQVEGLAVQPSSIGVVPSVHLPVAAWRGHPVRLTATFDLRDCRPAAMLPPERWRLLVRLRSARDAAVPLPVDLARDLSRIATHSCGFDTP